MVPLVARASVNGVSTVKAIDDDAERGQFSGSVVSAPSRKSGTIKLSDNRWRSPAAPIVRATKPPRCGSKSTYLFAGFSLDGAELSLPCDGSGCASENCGSP